MLGAKRQETRSWNTNYRGRLYIHASKGFPKSAQELCFTWPFNEYVNLNKKSLPLGQILGYVDLINTESSESCLANMKLSESEGSQEEYRFGDYSPGRTIFHLKNPVMFDKPIIARGSLNIWPFTL
jgi:hypothetical protein